MSGSFACELAVGVQIDGFRQQPGSRNAQNSRRQPQQIPKPRHAESFHAHRLSKKAIVKRPHLARYGPIPVEMGENAQETPDSSWFRDMNDSRLRPLELYFLRKAIAESRGESHGAGFQPVRGAGFQPASFGIQQVDERRLLFPRTLTGRMPIPRCHFDKVAKMVPALVDWGRL